MTHHYPIAFVDCETTGLDPFLHDPWEFAVILRNGNHDTEFVFHARPDLTNADSKGLEINRYHERTSAPDWEWHDPKTTAARLQGLLRGTLLVGSNPSFDAGMIGPFIGRWHPNPNINTRPWYHHTVDIATFAAGYLHGKGLDTPALPYRSYEMSRAVGVEPPMGDAAHTALGDARWARDVFDAITGKGGA